MLNKIIAVFLAGVILTSAAGINVYAQTNSFNSTKSGLLIKEKTFLDLQPTSQSINTKPESAMFKKENIFTDLKKQKSQGKGFSTTAKVLIGVGIAAAVIGVVVFAASRDKPKIF